MTEDRCFEKIDDLFKSEKTWDLITEEVGNSTYFGDLFESSVWASFIETQKQRILNQAVVYIFDILRCQIWLRERNGSIILEACFFCGDMDIGHVDIGQIIISELSDDIGAHGLIEEIDFLKKLKEEIEHAIQIRIEAGEAKC